MIYTKLSYIELNYYYNNSVILLNILDNIHNLISINHEYLNSSYVKAICNFYDSIINYDIMIKYNYVEDNYLIEALFIFIYYLLKQSVVNNYNILYTKYISKSIINISLNNKYSNILPHTYINIINNINKGNIHKYKGLKLNF